MNIFTISNVNTVLWILLGIVVLAITIERGYLFWKKKKYLPSFLQKENKEKKREFCKRKVDEPFCGGGKHLEYLHDSKAISIIPQNRLREILEKIELKTRKEREKEIGLLRKKEEIHAMEEEAVLVLIKRICEQAEKEEEYMRLYAEKQESEISNIIHETLLLFEKGNLEECEKMIEKTQKKQGFLWKCMGEKYMAFSQFRKAEKCFAKATEEIRKEDGEGNELFIEACNQWSYSLLLQKKEKEAFEASYKALSTAVQIFSKENCETGMCFSTVGNCLFEQENLIKAHDYWEESLRISSQIQNSPCLAVCYANLGRIYIREREVLEKGIFYIEESIREYGKHYGKNNERIFLLNNMLAMALYEHKQYAEAVKYFKKTYLQAEKVYGKAHSFLVTVLNNIGGTLFLSRKYNEAISYYYKSLRLNGHIVGDAHRDIAIIHDNLGRVWQAKGEYKKAAAHYKSALDIFEHLPGEEQKGKTEVIRNLIEVLKKMGDDALAEKYRYLLES